MSVEEREGAKESEAFTSTPAHHARRESSPFTSGLYERINWRNFFVPVPTGLPSFLIAPGATAVRRGSCCNNSREARPPESGGALQRFLIKRQLDCRSRGVCSRASLPYRPKAKRKVDRARGRVCMCRGSRVENNGDRGKDYPAVYTGPG